MSYPRPCGPGPPRAVVQPAKAGHKACRGRHHELARGPYECAECHARASASAAAAASSQRPRR